MRLRVDGTVDYVGEGRLQTVILEIEDTLSICRNLHRQSYAPNDDTDRVVVRVQLIDENELNVPFPHNVAGIEPGSEPLESRRASIYHGTVTWRRLRSKSTRGDLVRGALILWTTSLLMNA